MRNFMLILRESLNKGPLGWDHNDMIEFLAIKMIYNHNFRCRSANFEILINFDFSDRKKKYSEFFGENLMLELIQNNRRI